MSDYLHGVETKRENSRPTTVTGIDTSVIGLVGIAPVFDVLPENRKVNEIVLTTSERKDVQYFGYNRSDYTIPQALEIIRKQLPGAKVFVINVFDPDKHKSNVSSTLTFENGQIKLNEIGITGLTVQKGSETCAEDTDYTFDGSIIKAKAGGKLAEGGDVTVAYNYADVSKVTTAEIIGSVDVDGTRTGIKLLRDCKSIYGYKAKILIAPVYSAVKSVDTELQTLCKTLKAFTYICAPKGTTHEEAQQGRNENGEINFNINDIRAELAAPWLKVYNSFEDKEVLFPMDAWLAGLRAQIDTSEGVHVSTSNRQLIGVEGLEIPVYFELSDTGSDSNLYNGQGITTAVNRKGVIYSWGNRNSSFPAESGIETFSTTSRIADYIEESVEETSISVMADSINQGIINDIIEMVDTWFKSLTKQGVILGGSVWYDADDNSAEELANGHLILGYEFCPPPPLERLTYKSKINIQIITNALGGNN